MESSDICKEMQKLEILFGIRKLGGSGIGRKLKKALHFRHDLDDARIIRRFHPLVRSFNPGCNLPGDPETTCQSL